MKIKVIGVLMLLGVSLAQVAKSSQQQPGGGPCTNYGCMEIRFMSQALVNYTQGCVRFDEITGRKVRNTKGTQGEDPSTLGGIQSIRYSYVTCQDCAPPALNSIAVEGNELLAESVVFPNGYLGTFGRYECPLVPGGPGGIGVP